MNDRQQWKEFQAKIRQSGATTVYAARALLVKDYVDQERQRKEDDSFSKSDDDDEIDAIVRGARRRSISADEILSSIDDSVKISTMRRGSAASSYSLADDDRSHESMRSRNLHDSGSLSGREGRGSISGSQRHPKRSSFSFSLKQLTGMLPREEKARRHLATERREGFNTMVSGMLGREKPKHMRRAGSVTSLNLSVETRHVNSQQRRASVDAAIPAPRQRLDSNGSVDTSSSQPQRSSFSGVVEDMKQLSAYLSKLDADDYDTEEEEAKNTELTINRKIGSSPLAIVSTSSSYSEPVEIATDGKVKMFSLNEDEVLVDFPSRSRQTSLPTTGSCEDHDVYLDYEYNEEIPMQATPAKRASTGGISGQMSMKTTTFESSSYSTVGLATPTSEMGTCHLLADDEGEVFEKPANWVDYDDDSSDEEE